MSLGADPVLFHLTHTAVIKQELRSDVPVYQIFILIILISLLWIDCPNLEGNKAGTLMEWKYLRIILKLPTARIVCWD